MARIIAEYGFYLGWSFGMTAFLMVLEPVLIGWQRRTVLRQLRQIVANRGDD